MGAEEVRRELLDYTTTNGYNIDILSIYNTAEVIGDTTGLILGIIAYSIAIFMTLITTLDVAYITIPIFRTAMKSFRWDGSNERGLSAVSKDAVSAVEESYTLCLDKSALSIYLGKRLISYLIAVFVLFLILGGMGYIQDIVETIVRALLLATMGV